MWMKTSGYVVAPMSCCSGRKPRLANRFCEPSELINKEISVQKQTETSVRHSKRASKEDSEHKGRDDEVAAADGIVELFLTSCIKLKTQVTIICEAERHWQPWHTDDSHVCELRGRDHVRVF